MGKDLPIFIVTSRRGVVEFIISDVSQVHVRFVPFVFRYFFDCKGRKAEGNGVLKQKPKGGRRRNRAVAVVVVIILVS